MTSSVSPGFWIAAAAPVLALLVLVTSRWVRTWVAALLVVVLTVGLAFAVFGAGAAVLAVGMGKGLWLGAWILYVVFPAMLLYRIAERAGFQQIGAVFRRLFPRRVDNLLVLAWLLPSFVQGVAGFGTPVAVAAPLLVASGWARHRAVVYPLVGYHWSVTFGSMGSSFYLAALTAHLSPSQTTAFAHDASLLLGVNCLVAGALVLLLDGGLRALRAGLPLLLAAGVPMAVTLYAVTSVVPAVGSVTAGAVGFGVAAAVSALRRHRQPAPEPTPLVLQTLPARSRADGATAGDPPTGPEAGGHQEAPVPSRRAAWLVSPYVYLVALALAVLLVPASRSWVHGHLAFGPRFPATATTRGWQVPAVDQYTPVELFSHPGTYLVLACLLGYVTYRTLGMWTPRPVGELASSWWSSVRSSAVSIVALACVATVLIESGMVYTLARGVVRVAGHAYPAVAALVGALGSFLTGSTTSSNALFSALQANVAGLLHVPETVMLSLQTVGGNVGNSVAPVVIVIGVSAVGGDVPVHRVLRTLLAPAAVLLAVATGLGLLMLT